MTTPKFFVSVLLLFFLSGCIVSVDPRILDETPTIPVEKPPVENPLVNPPIVSPPLIPPADTNLTNPPVTPPITAPAAITLSKIEVAKHVTKKNCWVIYASNVYNVSAYTTHPGGNDYVPYCGKDMTNAFENQGHSTKADKILAGFLLGKVGETIPASSV